MNEQETALIIRLYDEQPLSVDRLPYTDGFDVIVDEMRHAFGPSMTHHNVYQLLLRTRKSKRLVRKQRKPAV